jgi:hypothetical protein
MGLFDKKRTVQPIAAAAGKSKFTRLALSKRDFSKWADNQGISIQLPQSILADRSRFLKTYFATVTRYVPAAKTAVWIWRNLCFTHSETKLSGGTPSQRNDAAAELTSLSDRVFPLKYAQSAGFDKLLNFWFMSCFRYGRFSGQIELLNDKTGIDRFKIFDPFSIYFEKETFSPFISEDGQSAKSLNPLAFYYYGLDADTDNPYGIALMEACDTLMQIANEMMEDMRYSSSNAGVPRLHIKVKQPPIMDGEDTTKYIERCNTYFDSTLNEMDELAPDDNVYTWSDVEIGIVGGQSSQSFVWKANLQAIQEDIISAFHLYPWLFGKQFGTTRNWVSAQFDVLMQMVKSIQIEAAAFADWISNTHLSLCGLPMVRVQRSFTSPRDPAAKDIAIADKIRLENTAKKLEMGFIDKDQAMREHGYEPTAKETIK